MGEIITRRMTIDINIGTSAVRWVATLLCIIGGACIGATGHDGWGWFLFVSLLFAPVW